MSFRKPDIVVALAGNPNSGKTTIFNALTGSKQHTGNWPGVTVEKKEGLFQFKGKEIQVVDLPGTYSLSSYTIDERIARDYLIHEKPDIVVIISDASNLERHLLLFLQIKELGLPVIVVLNMMDVAESRGMTWGGIPEYFKVNNGTAPGRGYRLSPTLLWNETS